MSIIPEELIERVRDTVDIVELIGEHVELKRTGADYRGPCPFHGGKHRNFAVIPKKQMFYCFVCHEAGDIFSFLMKRVGLEYPFYRTVSHQPACHRLAEHPGSYGCGSYDGTRNIQLVQDGTDKDHGAQPNAGSVCHPTGQVMSEKNTLIKTTIPDCRRPGEQNQTGTVRQAGNIIWQIE